MQGQKGVIRAVAQLHQRHAAIERQHAGVAQLLEKALPARPIALRRLRVRHPQAAEDDASHDQHQRRRVDIEAEPFEQSAKRDHGDDETDRAP
ncbi:hypothetical protein D3C78_1747720 [compost metagenome]